MQLNTPPAQLPPFAPRAITRCRSLVALAALVVAPFASADWKATRGNSEDLPGQNVTVTQDGKIVARFIHGEGQGLPYLAIYDDQGRLLTNAGIDKSGKSVGMESHHRGIFIGWSVIKSDLGTARIWGVGNEGSAKGRENAGPRSSMKVVEIEKATTTRDSATIVARIEWRAGTPDASGSDLLFTETRTMKVARPAAGVAAQVDVSFKLRPARDIGLEGDVQHAGIHMRVSHAVADHRDQTSYLWSPAGAAAAGKGYSKTAAAGTKGYVVGNDLQWGEFLFPLHGRWYTAMQMNSPRNPVEQFSTREYGRFGFFFRKELKQNVDLDLNYRFLVRQAEPPAESPKRSAAQVAKARKDADAAFAAFLRESR